MTFLDPRVIFSMKEMESCPICAAMPNRYCGPTKRKSGICCFVLLSIYVVLHWSSLPRRRPLKCADWPTIWLYWPVKTYTSDEDEDCLPHGRNSVSDQYRHVTKTTSG